MPLPVSLCHSPQGECGLKYDVRYVRGYKFSHSPQGECGLKLLKFTLIVVMGGHSPQGECGLKYALYRLPDHRGVTPRKGSAG